MPTFSVIIPTYGRPDQLRNCLDTLVEVDPPDGGFEVVIVDDGTPEPLEPQLRRWRCSESGSSPTQRAISRSDSRLPAEVGRQSSKLLQSRVRFRPDSI